MEDERSEAIRRAVEGSEPLTLETPESKTCAAAELLSQNLSGLHDGAAPTYIEIQLEALFESAKQQGLALDWKLIQEQVAEYRAAGKDTQTAMLMRVADRHGYDLNLNIEERTGVVQRALEDYLRRGFDVDAAPILEHARSRGYQLDAARLQEALQDGLVNIAEAPREKGAQMWQFMKFILENKLPCNWNTPSILDAIKRNETLLMSEGEDERLKLLRKYAAEAGIALGK